MADKQIYELDDSGALAAGDFLPVAQGSVDATKATYTKVGTLIGFLNGAATTTVTAFNVGAVGTPGMTFVGDLNTGIYWIGADSFGLATNGTLRLSVSTTAVTSTLPINGPAGAVGAPAFTGTDTDTGMWFSAANTIDFSTGGARQFQITNTASAVNFLSVTATESGDYPYLRALGSNSNVGMYIAGKGDAEITVMTNSTRRQFGVRHTTGTPDGYLVIQNTTGGSNKSSLQVGGVASTDVDLGLIPAGTGVVSFGTHSAVAAETITGYITIKDAAGNTRKLAVIS